MSQIVQSAQEQGAAARASRFLTQGIVKSVNPTTHTAVVDVGQLNAQGNEVPLPSVPYTPQNPPSPGDTVTLGYTNNNAHSVYIVGGRLGGGNSQETIINLGGVTSLNLVTGGTQVKGAILFAGAGVSQSGNTFTFSGAGNRSAASATTGTLAAGASDRTQRAALGKCGVLLMVTTDRPARIVFYAANTARTSDASRAQGMTAARSAGIIAEVITTPGNLTVAVTPFTLFANLEMPVVATIPIAVTNNDVTAGTVTVTVTKLTLES